MKIADLKNKKIAILGFGLEGKSAMNFLQKQGITDITILDQNPDLKNIEPLALEKSKDSGKSLESGSLNFILGETYLDTLGDFDVIIKSPGVSPFGPKLLPYRDKFISGTQLFCENYTGKIIGITGTKGKSTVSSLLFACLIESGYKVKLVGNIGTPVLDEVELSEDLDYIVYEMSSYMLQDFIPKLHIGYINNIYPCHLDWHYNSMNIYREAKLNILKNTGYKVVNGELVEDLGVLGIDGKKIFFGSRGEYTAQNNTINKITQEIFSDTQIQLKGHHNMMNICGVLSMLEIIMGDSNELLKIASNVLKRFSGLPHRIENIGEYEGITFIDDAYASTPDSTIAAIKTFAGNLQTLFLGGQDSGFDISTLRQEILNSEIQNIIFFPDTSEKIFPEIISRDTNIAFEIEIDGRLLQCIKTRSMKLGVDFAYKTTLPGKIALLSCAAPSFSVWKNRDEKASEFLKEVKEY